MTAKRLSWDEFCETVRQVVEGLPEPFQPYLENVVVDVREQPEPDDWARLEDRDDAPAQGGLLLGLFTGVPLVDQSYGHRHPNSIRIFRRPLERVSRNRDELIQNIRETVLHELAHHFGFDEDEVERMEDARERRKRGGNAP
jgi:predicted Zn-dependent protease with MMP-like domain